MNDPAFDQLLETMLCEAQDQAAAPDVSAQVLAILEAERNPVVGLPQIDTTRNVKRRSDAWLPMTLAAALLIAISGYVWELNNGRPQPADTSTVAHNAPPKPQAGAAASKQTTGTADPHGAARSTQPAAPDKAIVTNTPPRGHFEIGLNDLPFNTPATVPASEPQQPAIAKQPKIDRLPPDEIIHRVDELLAQAWRRMDIQPQNEISTDELTQRLANVVAGRSQGEKLDAQAARHLIANDTAALIDGYIDNQQTANHLGTRWAQHLLGEAAWRRMSEAQRTAAGKLFAGNFRGEQPFDTLVQEMLTSEGPSSPDDPAFEPATLWKSGLAGASAIPLTNQFCDVLLDLDVACGRCHTHPLEGNITQRNYWNLNAIFQTGVQWQLGNQGELEIAQDLERDRSKDAVFYESPDGIQMVASPAVVDDWIGGSGATNGPTNLRELAAEIEHSDRLARATINGLWKVIYGNRLVGRTSDPLAPPADEAFVAARNLMAQQLRAYNYDLGAAAAWMISAQPMRLQSTLSLFDQDSLFASEAILNSAEIQQRAFAGFANEPRNWSFEELIVATETFNKASGQGSLVAPAALLAQATDSNAPAKPDQKSKAQLRLESLRRAFPANDAANTLPAGWLASLSKKRGFEQQAKHLFYVAGNPQVSDQQMAAAKRIRLLTDTDEAALNQLWWAIRLSDGTP
ncbi:hypothetical protein Poly24_04530 [Rosistilla carotiformis]|uniref:DUF1549 domain-containing protein n=1 Tax=Rosistilla carotiformis TaxID=2528017 RepID=A0A518JMI4_9BACT|nr:DUF1549 domain-containing protein [Rosistilla carotiformis]QDV66765.1 hypothetical protein Poly24_04530 [Rosistilla carotiformis]